MWVRSSAHPPFLVSAHHSSPLHYVTQLVDSLPSIAQHGQALGRGDCDVGLLPTTQLQSSARLSACQQHGQPLHPWCQGAQLVLTRCTGGKPCCAVQCTHSLHLIAVCGASTLLLQVLPLIDDLLSGLTGKHDVVEVVEQMVPQLLRRLNGGSSQRQVLDLLGTLLEQIPQMAVRVQLWLMCHFVVAGMNGSAQHCLSPGLLAHTTTASATASPKGEAVCSSTPMTHDRVMMTLPDRSLAGAHVQYLLLQ